MVSTLSKAPDDDKNGEFEIKSTVKIPKKAKPGEKAPKPGEKENKIFRFSYDIASGSLSDITDIDPEKKYPSWANISPNGKYVIFAKDFNLWYIYKV